MKISEKIRYFMADVHSMLMKHKFIPYEYRIVQLLLQGDPKGRHVVNGISITARKI